MHCKLIKGNMIVAFFAMETALEIGQCLWVREEEFLGLRKLHAEDDLQRNEQSSRMKNVLR